MWRSGQSLVPGSQIEIGCLFLILVQSWHFSRPGFCWLCIFLPKALLSSALCSGFLLAPLNASSQSPLQTHPSLPVINFHNSSGHSPGPSFPLTLKPVESSVPLPLLERTQVIISVVLTSLGIDTQVRVWRVTSLNNFVKLLLLFLIYRWGKRSLEALQSYG